MRRYHITRFVGLAIGLAVAGSLCLVAWRLNAMSEASQPITLEVGDGITYGEAMDSETQELIGEVEYDYTSPAGIQAYRTLNREALTQLKKAGIKTIQVQVFFNHTLS